MNRLDPAAKGLVRDDSHLRPPDEQKITDMSRPTVEPSIGHNHLEEGVHSFVPSGGFAVGAEQHLTLLWPLIHVMHSESGSFRIMGGERKPLVRADPTWCRK